jgi:hypothetical protein
MAELDKLIQDATDKDAAISKLTSNIESLKLLSKQGSSSRTKRGRAEAQDVDTQIEEMEREAAQLREISRGLWLKVNEMQAQQRV